MWPRSGSTCERISVPRSITLGDVLQPLADLDVVDHRVDRRERAHHLFDRQPDFERLVALRVERLRRGHAAGHPQQDAGVGLGDRMLDRGAAVIGAQAVAARRP